MLRFQPLRKTHYDWGHIQVEGEIIDIGKNERLQTVFAVFHVRDKVATQSSIDVAAGTIFVTMKDGVGRFSVDLPVTAWITDHAGPSADELKYEFSDWSVTIALREKPEVDILK
jgi:hypothetical protein